MLLPLYRQSFNLTNSKWFASGEGWGGGRGVEGGVTQTLVCLVFPWSSQRKICEDLFSLVLDGPSLPRKVRLVAGRLPVAFSHS